MGPATQQRIHPRRPSTGTARCVLLDLCLLAVAGCSKGYQREGGKWAWVWYDGGGRQVRYLDGAKGKLTVLANDKYAMTADHVYLGGVRLPKADPATFEMLTYPYAKDAQRVYCGSVPILDADPAAFRVQGGLLEPGFYSSAQPFMDTYGPLPQVQPEAEIVVCQGWATDGQHWFYGPYPVAGANAATFKILNDWYATDGTQVFCGAQVIEDADVESFRVVRYLEAEDNDHLYYLGKATKRGNQRHGKGE